MEVEAAAEAVAGPDPLSEEEKKQLHLPLRLGEFGLPCLVDLAEAAWLGSWLQCLAGVVRASPALRGPSSSVSALNTTLRCPEAKLAAERLDRGADAIRLLKEVLEADPSAEGVVDQLERHAERQKDYETVALVLERRVDQASDEKTQITLLQKLGVLYAEKVKDNSAANVAWRRVLDVSPGHKRALRVLRKTFVDAADWDGKLFGSFVSQLLNSLHTRQLIELPGMLPTR